jgi:hypothetical protein
MKTSRSIGLMSKVDNLIKNQKYLPLYWLILASLIIVVDYVAGPLIQFPILYLIPIGLASWYSGRWWGLSFAFSMPLIRLYFLTLLDAPWTIFEAAINATIRVVVFASFAYLVDKIVTYKGELEKEVHVLKGILPICSFCKKIRNQDGNWEALEHYITVHSEAEFTHGMCPECAKQHYPDYFKWV